MIEDPKKDAAPCVALIKDVVKTKMDQVSMNEMKLQRRWKSGVKDEKMVADQKKEEPMVESYANCGCPTKTSKEGYVSNASPIFCKLEEGEGGVYG